MSSNNVSSDINIQSNLLATHHSNNNNNNNPSNLELFETSTKTTTTTTVTNSFNSVDSLLSNDLFSSLNQLSNFQQNDYFEQNGSIMNNNNNHSITNNQSLIRVNSLISPTPSPTSSSNSSSALSNEINTQYVQNISKPINNNNNNYEQNNCLYYTGLEFKCKFTKFNEYSMSYLIILELNWKDYESSILNNNQYQRINHPYTSFEPSGILIPQLQANVAYNYPNNNNSYLINGGNNIQKQSNNSQTCLTLIENTERNMNNHASSTSSSSSSESFKLIEKLQPKKSRTKYTKEQVISNLLINLFDWEMNVISFVFSFISYVKYKQIEILESAYWTNPYPDLITVEHLCKSLGISREKINVNLNLTIIIFIQFLIIWWFICCCWRYGFKIEEQEANELEQIIKIILIT